MCGRTFIINNHIIVVIIITMAASAKLRPWPPSLHDPPYFLIISPQLISVINVCPKNLELFSLRCKGKLLLRKPRTDYLKRSFSYSSVLFLNNLSEKVCTAIP